MNTNKGSRQNKFLLILPFTMVLAVKWNSPHCYYLNLQVLHAYSPSTSAFTWRCILLLPRTIMKGENNGRFSFSILYFTHHVNSIEAAHLLLANNFNLWILLMNTRSESLTRWRRADPAIICFSHRPQPENTRDSSSTLSPSYTFISHSMSNTVQN